MTNNIRIIKTYILSFFMSLLLLSTTNCGNSTSHMNSVNGEQDQTSIKFGSEEKAFEQTICPFCRGNYRNLYTLVNKGGSALISLFCDGCEKIWLSPGNISKSGAKNRKELKKEFDNMKFSEILNKGHWSTKEEVIKSEEAEWKEMMDSNIFFLNRALR